MDANNPVVQCCLAGLKAEAEDRPAEALDLFVEAWATRSDDFDACIAAHYVARHQAEPTEMLRWNQAALDHANAVGDERVRSFYPSLYLNLGWSHERLGDLAAASRCYELAATQLDADRAGLYDETLRAGIAAGRERTAGEVSSNLE